MISDVEINKIGQAFLQILNASSENIFAGIVVCAIAICPLAIIASHLYRPNGPAAKVRSWHRALSLVVFSSNTMMIGAMTWLIASALAHETLPDIGYDFYQTLLLLVVALFCVNITVVSHVNISKLPGLRTLIELDIILTLSFITAFALAEYNVVAMLVKMFSLEDLVKPAFHQHLWLVLVAYPFYQPIVHFISQTRMIRRIREYFRYFGYGLPARDIENFITVKPKSRRINRPMRSSFSINRELEGLSENATDLLNHVQQQLGFLARYPMSQKKRCLLAELYAPTVLKFYYSTLSKHQEGGQIPDKPDKAREIDDILRLIMQLKEVYNVVFSDIYPLSNWSFGPLRKEFRLSAIRIIELANIEQQLAACRYKAISSESWRAINTVYAIMEACETVTYHVPLLQFESSNRKRKTLHGNILSQYLQMQVAAYWDLMCLPTYTIPTMFRYIRNNLDLLDLKPLEQEHLTQYHLVVAQVFEHGPLPHQKASQVMAHSGVQCPQYTLNISSFLLKLGHDHSQLTEDTKRKNPYTNKHNIFKRFSPSEQRTILRHFREALMMKEELKTLSQLGAISLQRTQLWIYMGFKDCFNMVLDLGKQTDINDSRVLRDKLAERSAFLGDDDQSETETQWYTFFENESFIGLRTQENLYSLHMRIGRLLIYNKQSEGNPEPQLGLITRLERLGSGKVDILIRKFVGQVEIAAYLHKNPDSRGEDTKPVKQAALKVSDKRNRQLLIFPSSGLCCQGMPIILLEAKKQRPMEFGKIAIQNEDIIICNIQQKKPKEKRLTGS